MKELVKLSFVYGIGTVLTKLIGFFLIPLYTSYFSTSEYGLLSLLNVILQLTTFVLLFGLNQASMRFYKKCDKIHLKKQIYGNATILLLIIPIVLIIFLVPILKLIISEFVKSISFKPYVFIILVIAFLQPIQKLCTGFMRINKHGIRYVIFNIGLFVIQVIFIILMVVYLNKGVIGQLYGRLFAHLIFFLISLYILFNYADFTINKKIILKLLKFGIPLIPFFIFTWIGEASGRFYIEYFLSIEDIGIFALAVQFSGLFNIISLAFNNAILPYYYDIANHKKNNQKINELFVQTISLFSFILIIMLLLYEPIVLFWVKNSKYHIVINYIPILLYSNYLRLIYKLCNLNLLFHEKTKIISTIKIISSLILLIVMYMFFSFTDLGINSVGFSLLISSIFSIIATFLISQKVKPINYHWIKISFIFFITTILALHLYLDILQ